MVLGLAPRLALALFWIGRPERVEFAFDGFVVPLLGFLFLPIVTFVYVLIAPAGFQGLDLLWLGLALLADVGIWVAGGYLSRRRLSSRS